MIEAALGDGKRYGLNIHYSHEPVALETAGGIAQALSLLKYGVNRPGEQPFLTINADIYCEMDFSASCRFCRICKLILMGMWRYLVLVDNPAHHPMGDFVLDHGRVLLSGKNSLTFSGIGIYLPRFFVDVVPGLRQSSHPCCARR